jgi:hypothetical protein
MPQINVRISDQVASSLDERRGGVQRTFWIQSVVEQVLTPGAVLVQLGDLSPEVDLAAARRGVKRSQLIAGAVSDHLHAVGVQMPLTAEVMEMVDRARGSHSRADWCLNALKSAARQGPISSGPLTKTGAGRYLTAPDVGQMSETELANVRTETPGRASRPDFMHAHTPQCKCPVCKPPRE